MRPKLVDTPGNLSHSFLPNDSVISTRARTQNWLRFACVSMCFRLDGTQTPSPGPKHSASQADKRGTRSIGVVSGLITDDD
jgi:hypothetical protein